MEPPLPSTRVTSAQLMLPPADTAELQPPQPPWEHQGCSARGGSCQPCCVLECRMVHCVQKRHSSSYRSATSPCPPYSWAKSKETRAGTPALVTPHAKQQQQRFTTKPALSPSQGHTGSTEIAFGTRGAQEELLVELDFKGRRRNFHFSGIHRYRS